MKIKCGSCGKDILVPDDLVAGQHVRCPYCNVKTAFDKPSRVALPDGFEVKRKARTKIDEMKRERAIKAEAAPEDHEGTRRKLGVIRPAAQAAGPDLNAEAIKRRMEEDAQGKRIADEKTAAAQSSARREKNVRRAIGVALLALLAAGIACWIGACSRERASARLDALRRQEQRAREEERQRQIWQEEREKQRAEQEAKLEAEREAARKTAEQRKKERAAEEEARAAQAAAEAQKEAERQRNAEAYKAAALAFRAKEFRMADNQKILLALGTRDDAFYFCFAPESEGLPIYEVSSASNGTRRVVKMTENGTASPEDFDGFTNRLDRSDYLMAHGAQVCFRTTRPHPMSGRPVAGKESVDPTKAFFDKLYGAVKTLDLTFDELTFDIVFVPKQTKKEIPVLTVEFGCECPMLAVRAAVIEAFPMPEGDSRMKVKKFKRTAVFWNGSVIKQSMEGVVYVPRSYENRYGRPSGQERQRWEVLYNQAQEEEEAERRYYEEARQRFEEKTALENDKVRIKWMKAIDETLATGVVGYRAKIAKEKEK